VLGVSVATGAAASSAPEFDATMTEKQPEHIVPVDKLYHFLCSGVDDLEALIGNCPPLLELVPAGQTVPTYIVEQQLLTMPFLHRLCLWLEHSIYYLEFKDDDKQHLLLDVAAKPRKVLAVPNEKLPACLYFAGSVSLQKSATSHLLAIVAVGDVSGGLTAATFEVGIYIRGDKLRDLGSACPVLAWLVAADAPHRVVAADAPHRAGCDSDV
jgi:hypothetical protein